MKTNRSPDEQHSATTSRIAMRFVLLIGVLSFFADFTHEGSRSILGPFLASMQASAFVVGVVTGFGELAGYALRYFSGRFADITGRFWPTAITGYVVQMAAVPALALTHTWQSAAVFIILERVGRAIRNPPRDVMLSHAAKHIGGYGWTFGIHEACDQFGAMFGPLVMAAVLSYHGTYQLAFAVLLLPALLNLLFVFVAYRLYPKPQELDEDITQTNTNPKRFSTTFWVYLAGACLVAAGFADYPLLAYHFAHTDAMPAPWIAVFYSVAMAVSGASSLLFGRLFDRYGFRVLIGLTLLVSLFAPLVFLGGFKTALLGAAIWGMGMGVHESIIPAAVTPMVPSQHRATAFGLFTAGYGIFWFLGSATIGFVYDYSVAWTIVFCVVTQLLAIPLFAWVGKRQPCSTPPDGA
ncbi:MFS transporter [Pusillimonas sp. ANT_WB101]|uniref:MFS transporter n=1 Tax=Pusillimonas sp. ANT_WB101 TaxID=2597356 RepID=UPI0011EFE9BB|nr:MFS transporter [Pusillimonas sp. ANT_WB101]KAA0911121.1 MFS transporter [Pusillimonas sp. ANT_WB101]